MTAKTAQAKRHKQNVWEELNELKKAGLIKLIIKPAQKDLELELLAYRLRNGGYADTADVLEHVAQEAQ